MRADPERPSVTLKSGEVVEADVVVGCDGYMMPGWVTRRVVMEELEQDDEGDPTGIAVYKYVSIYLPLAPISCEPVPHADAAPSYRTRT